MSSAARTKRASRLRAKLLRMGRSLPMNRPFQLLNRLFGSLAVAFWLGTLAAIIWQFWQLLVEKSSQTLTVKLAIQGILGAEPSFAADSLQVLYAILSGLSLVVFLGVLALTFSALAKLFS